MAKVSLLLVALLASSALAQNSSITSTFSVTPTRTMPVAANDPMRLKASYDAVALECGKDLAQYLNSLNTITGDINSIVSKSADSKIQKCNSANGINIIFIPYSFSQPLQYRLIVSHKWGRQIFSFTQTGLVNSN